MYRVHYFYSQILTFQDVIFRVCLFFEYNVYAEFFFAKNTYFMNFIARGQVGTQLSSSNLRRSYFKGSSVYSSEPLVDQVI